MIVDFALELIPGAGPIRQFIERHKKSNVDLLFQAFQENMRIVVGRMDRLDVAHQQFLRTEFMALVVDGIKRAEALRSRERVERLARILATAAEEGPKTPADDVEEFMRVSCELGELDIKALAVLENYNELEHHGHFAPHCLPTELAMPDMDDDTPRSIFLKVESFGLVEAFVGELRLGANIHTYGLMKKGRDLLRFIRQS